MTTSTGLQTEGPALHYVRGTLLKKAEEVRGGDLSGVFHDVTRATPVRARAWHSLNPTTVCTSVQGQHARRAYVDSGSYFPMLYCCQCLARLHFATSKPNAP